MRGAGVEAGARRAILDVSSPVSVVLATGFDFLSDAISVVYFLPFHSKVLSPALRASANASLNDVDLAAGAALGTLAGLMAGLVGVLIGPIIGAVIGEWMARRDGVQASKAGLAAGISFLLGIVAKVGIAFMMIGVLAVAWLV